MLKKGPSELFSYVKLGMVCVCSILNIMNHNKMSQQFHNVNLDHLQVKFELFYLHFSVLKILFEFRLNKN